MGMSTGPSMALGGPGTSLWAFGATALSLCSRPGSGAHVGHGSIGVLDFESFPQMANRFLTHTTS